MKTKWKRPRPSGAVLVLAVSLSPWLAERLAAQEPWRELSGTLHLTWIQREAEEQAIPTLVGDDGRIHRLALSSAQLDALGGVLSLTGRRVTVLVPASAASRPAPGEIPVQVQSVVRVSGRPWFDPDPLRVSMADEERPAVLPFITLLCRYSDSAVEPHPLSRYQEIMSEAYPNVGDYWAEISGGRVSLAGSRVLGWYSLPSPESSYAGEAGAGSYPSQRLMDDCMAAADAEVDFSAFRGVNIQVNGAIDTRGTVLGYATVGYSTLDGPGRSYLLALYSLGAGRATYAHEIGHTLGLPHSTGPYHNTYDSRWDVMSGGRWGEAGNQAAVGTIAYHRDRLGWVPAAQRIVAPAGSSAITLVPPTGDTTGSDARIVLIPLPSGASYTVEARRFEGYDAGIPDEGVLIHHVDPARLSPARVVDVDADGDPNDGGAVWHPGETFQDREQGVEVAVDGISGRSFRITVRVQARDSVHVVAAGHRRVVPFGWSGELVDSAFIQLTGPEAAERAWSARSYQEDVVLTRSGGTGSGWLRWRRRVEVASAGERTAFIAVQSPGAESSVAEVVDTLVIEPATGLSGAFAHGSGRSWAMAGRDQTGFFLSLPALEVAGPGAGEARWRVVRKPAWMTLSPDSGVGSASLSVSRTAAGLAAGSHVDTVEITIDGAAEPALFIDRFEVAGPIELRPQWTAGTRSVPQEAGPVLDSVYVEVMGPRAEEIELSVGGAGVFGATYDTHRGSGSVRFWILPGDLEPGRHFGHLAISASIDQRVGAAVQDSVEVVAAPPSFVVSRLSFNDTAYVGEWSEATVHVQPQGAGASTRAWRGAPAAGSAHRIAMLPWTDSEAELPIYSPVPGARAVRWARQLEERPAGLGVDTLVIAFEGESAAVLVLDSIWVVRNDSARSRMAISSDSVRPSIDMGADYSDTLRVTGAAGTLLWSVSGGSLPPGLALDAATGVVFGVPEAAGPYRFTLTVRTADDEAAAAFRLEVRHPALGRAAVVDHLLAGSALPLAHARYLDLLGNRNGVVDLGDVHRWLLETETLPERRTP